MLLLATAGGKGLIGLDPDARRGLEDPLSALLDEAAAEFVLGRELRQEEENAALRVGFDEGAIAEMKNGLGEYMIAARRLERRLDEAEDSSPEGFGVTMATVDWARAGMRHPISGSHLRELWKHYLRPGTQGTEQEFARGLLRARTPLYTSVALIRGSETFRPYDYIASYVQRVRKTPIEPNAWDLIIAWAAESNAFEAGIAAWGHNDPQRAVRAFAAAAGSVDRSLAAAAAFNLGVIIELIEMDAFFEARRLGTSHADRGQEAIQAYQRADACGHHRVPRGSAVARAVAMRRNETLAVAALSRPAALTVRVGSGSIPPRSSGGRVLYQPQQSRPGHGSAAAWPAAGVGL